MLRIHRVLPEGLPLAALVGVLSTVLKFDRPARRAFTVPLAATPRKAP